MKVVGIAGVILATISAVLATGPLPVTAVEQVDLDRYCGTWYEIAHLPNWFQRKCACNTTAEYSKRPDGKIRVINRCSKADGSYAVAEGIARKQESNGSNAKLEVRFAPSWLGWIPFVWGTYWIIDLAPDYSYAAVGDPSRKYLWILSRTPQMDSAACANLLGRMKNMGFKVDSLVFTSQKWRE